jgi:hypothetical protein
LLPPPSAWTLQSVLLEGLWPCSCPASTELTRLLRRVTKAPQKCA